MATPPKAPAPPAPKQAAPPPPVPPQQAGPGIPPKPTPDPTAQTQLTLNIHGVVQGPHPNMAPEADLSGLTDATRAEMEAGKAALGKFSDRTRAEMEYGKSIVARKGGASPSKSD